MIYLDNSATTWPKPRSVTAAMHTAMMRYSFNSGRGGYRESLAAVERLFATRVKLADFINCKPENIAFTPNCTYALNMAIKGVVSEGDSVIISSLEHNAVARPVSALVKRGIIKCDYADYSFDPCETVNNFKKLDRKSVV